METKIRGAANAKTHVSVTESVVTLFRRALSIFPQNTLPYEMVRYGLPYEASRTYRTMKTEFERIRSKALVEANWARLHGL